MTPDNDSTSPSFPTDWRDIGKQLDKIYSERMKSQNFDEEMQILAMLKELVKEQVSYEDSDSTARTTR